MSQMEREAAESAEVAARLASTNAAASATLAVRLQHANPTLVLTCARGSSDNAATFAKYLIETTLQTPVASYAPSVSSIYRTAWSKLAGTLFMVISQSGRSPDLLASARAARTAGALVVALVNDTTAPLAEIAEVVLPLQAGVESSVAATKSFIAAQLALVQLVAAWARDPILQRAFDTAPQALQAALELDWSTAEPWLVDARSLYVVGRGLTLATAQEAALKLKETAAIHAEAYSAAELQHGPLAIVGKDFPVLMFRPVDAAGADFDALAKRLGQQGARVIVTGGSSSPGAFALPVVQTSHPSIDAIVQSASFYALAARVSRARGLDPDNPRHLQKVTETR